MLTKPPLPATRGTLTVADLDADDPIGYGEAVLRWARATWDAHAELHPTARAWIQAAFA